MSLSACRDIAPEAFSYSCQLCRNAKFVRLGGPGHSRSEKKPPRVG
jgi:hypothetical protein